MYYENVPESFSINIDCGEMELVELQSALQKLHEVQGGALFCQLRPILVSEHQAFFDLEGSWFPPEFADRLKSLINEWRISRGIPAKEDIANV